MEPALDVDLVDELGKCVGDVLKGLEGHRMDSLDKLSVVANIFLNRLPKFARFGLVDRARQFREAEALAQRFDVRVAGVRVRWQTRCRGNRSTRRQAEHRTGAASRQSLLACASSNVLSDGQIANFRGVSAIHLVGTRAPRFERLATWGKGLQLRQGRYKNKDN